MSSPVTLSGFNNIDFSGIVNALMQQASEPLTALQTKQDSINSQIKSMTSFGNKVNALKTAAETLSDTTNFSAFTATTSDSTAVTADTGAGAIAGHYDIQVLDLARSQVTASTSTAPDADTTLVATGGSLTIGGKTVSISGNVTMTGLAKAINNTEDIGVAASVIRSGVNQYRLVLTSTTTGNDGAFTVTNGLTGGASAVTFTDTDGDGVSGDSTADNAVQASDARVLVNNVEAQSSTNEFSEAIPGVTFTVMKKDPTATIGLDVSADSTALKSSLSGFISSYNSLVGYMSDQATSAAQGDAASIGHSPVLQSLRHALRSTLLGALGTGSVKNLAQAGIEFTITGQLKINDKLFSAAVSNHAPDVESLFTSASGVFKSLSTSLKAYSGSGGFLSTTQKRMNDQVSGLSQQITNMQDRLAKQKLSLQQEYAATDTLMTQMKSQSSSLTGISSSMSTL